MYKKEPVLFYFQIRTKLFSLLAVACIFTSCDQAKSYHKLMGSTMGTYYAITYEGSLPEKTKLEIDQLLQQFNNSLSTYEPESFISRLNQSTDGFTLTDNDLYFMPVFLRASELMVLTNGSLNPAVMPLVNYWGFGYKGKMEITSMDSLVVDSLLNIVNQSKFQSEKRGNSTFISKSIPSAELDYSSLAKGYGIDVIAEYFVSNNVDNYLIDIGGEARARGINAYGRIWTLAINKPKDDVKNDELEVILLLEDRSIATSGNYRNFNVKDGKKYGHILDPKTGYPALTNLLSASIIADDCMTADGLATAMMVMGLDEAIVFLEKNIFPACLIYDADGDENLEKYYANGFEKLVVQEE